MNFQPNLHLKSIRSKSPLPKSTFLFLISHFHPNFSFNCGRGVDWSLLNSLGFNLTSYDVLRRLILDCSELNSSIPMKCSILMIPKVVFFHEIFSDLSRTWLYSVMSGEEYIRCSLDDDCLSFFGGRSSDELLMREVYACNDEHNESKRKEGVVAQPLFDVLLVRKLEIFAGQEMNIRCFKHHVFVFLSLKEVLEKVQFAGNFGFHDAGDLDAIMASPCVYAVEGTLVHFFVRGVKREGDVLLVHNLVVEWFKPKRFRACSLNGISIVKNQFAGSDLGGIRCFFHVVTERDGLTCILGIYAPKGVVYTAGEELVLTRMLLTDDVLDLNVSDGTIAKFQMCTGCIFLMLALEICWIQLSLFVTTEVLILPDGAVMNSGNVHKALDNSVVIQAIRWTRLRYGLAICLNAAKCNKGETWWDNVRGAWKPLAKNRHRLFLVITSDENEIILITMRCMSQMLKILFLSHLLCWFVPVMSFVEEANGLDNESLVGCPIFGNAMVNYSGSDMYQLCKNDCLSIATNVTGFVRGQCLYSGFFDGCSYRCGAKASLLFRIILVFVNEGVEAHSLFCIMKTQSSQFGISAVERCCPYTELQRDYKAYDVGGFYTSFEEDYSTYAVLKTAGNMVLFTAELQCYLDPWHSFYVD